MNLLDYIYSRPEIYFGLIIGVVLYSVIHQYRADKLIKGSMQEFGFWDKLLLFHYPFMRNTLQLQEHIRKKIHFLAKEYFIVNSTVLAYFAIGYIYYRFFY